MHNVNHEEVYEKKLLHPIGCSDWLLRIARCMIELDKIGGQPIISVTGDRLPLEDRDIKSLFMICSDNILS